MKNFKIETYDGYELYCQFDEAKDAKGVVVFSHGFVEYGAHYSSFANQLARLGYHCLRYDVRGHGRTTAPLGELKAYEDFADDLNRCVEWVTQYDSTLPIITMGFSLGGMITALYGILYPFSSTAQVLIGAGLEVHKQFEGMHSQSISIHQFLEFLGTDGDAGIKQLIAMDSPYVLKTASKQFLVEALCHAQEFIHEHASMYNLPVLIMHGKNDPIVKPESSQVFYDEIGSSDKTLEFVAHQEHDLLRVVAAKQIIEHIVEWMDERV